MELTDRKQQILSTIVKAYVMTGEPVGSKALCESLGGISSATIRNEMSYLAEHGYLTQPHTSAGRIPTDRAYRLYIDRLMPRHSLSESERSHVQRLMPGSLGDSEQGVRSALHALSNATRCAAIITTQVASGTLIHRVELIPMGLGRALVVLVTSTGAVRSRLFGFSGQLTAAVINRFLELVENQLIGCELSLVHPATLQTLAAGAGEYALVLTPLIAALGELIEEASRSRLELVGETRLLSLGGLTLSKAHELFELFSRGDEVLAMLDAWGKESGVIIGGDTSYTALERSSLVLSRYKLGNTRSGYVGIIGPTRMDYEFILPCIEYFAQLLGSGETVKG